VTVVAAAWLALGFLIFLNRNNPTVWTYYPLKLAFFTTVVFIVMALGLVIALLVQHRRHRVIMRMGAVVVAALVVGVIVILPRVDVGLVRLNPIVRIVASHPEDSQGGELIQRLAKSPTPAVLWATHRGIEMYTDLWLLQLRDDSLSGTSPLRLAAYNQLFEHTTKELCVIVKILGPTTVVYTPSSSLKGALASECPAVSAHFAPVPSVGG
jgi:hypothetical protein